MYNRYEYPKLTEWVDKWNYMLYGCFPQAPCQPRPCLPKPSYYSRKSLMRSPGVYRQYVY